MSKRTDCHRPGAIIPGHYEYLCSYSRKIGTGEDAETYGLDEAAAFEAAATAEGKAVFGRIGKCGVCGAHYNTGDIWAHLPTGDLLHLGHDCAWKYSLLVDRSAFELEINRIKQAQATALIKRERAETRAAFLAENPGLAAALETDHYIVKDIAARFANTCTLSPKQVALVLKLSDEAKNPRAEERNCPAPAAGKRVDFVGQIVSIKSVDSQYGTTTKMTVKVFADDGACRLAWGTMPASLFCSAWAAKRGDLVEVRATLKAGREPHFALMSRPNACVVSYRPESRTLEEKQRFEAGEYGPPA